MEPYLIYIVGNYRLEVKWANIEPLIRALTMPPYESKADEADESYESSTCLRSCDQMDCEEDSALITDKERGEVVNA